jgi:hypothetical protein
MDCARSKRLTRTAAVCFFSLALLPNVWAQAPPNAQELLRQMTLEEKIAQLSQLPGMPIPEFKEQVGSMEEVIRKYGAGSVLWVSDLKDTQRRRAVGHPFSARSVISVR